MSLNCLNTDSKEDESINSNMYKEMSIETLRLMRNEVNLTIKDRYSQPHNTLGLISLMNTRNELSQAIMIKLNSEAV